ncbi:MAG: patatin-like phospholipase family protein [bacterium]|nr:patatin-like phospholipase family protein [bacterium]
MAKKVGLALSGGGARGFAHVGVLKALVENNIPIDLIAGTSAGSFVGGAYAAGLSVDEIVEIGKKISWFGVAGFSYSPKGFLSNSAMKGFIEKSFPVTRFENLRIPFTAVACDLETGEEIYLKDQGDLTNAIRASCAIPGVFVPVIDDGRQLVDGGVVSPIPTRAVKKMGAEVIIAVDLITCGTTYWGSPTTLVGTLFQSAMIMLRTTSKHQHYRADVIIEPAISHIRPDEIARRDELIELGYRSVVDSLDEIRKAVESN